VEEDAGAGGERKARVRRAVTGRHASARTVAPLFRRDEEGRRCTDVTRRNCCRRIHSPRAPVVPHPLLPVGRGARGGATEHLGWIRAGSRGVSSAAADTQSGGARDAGAPTFRRSPSVESAPRAPHFVAASGPPDGRGPPTRDACGRSGARAEPVRRSDARTVGEGG
jgi:hypothetical protein